MVAVEGVRIPPTVTVRGAAVPWGYIPRAIGLSENGHEEVTDILRNAGAAIPSSCKTTYLKTLELSDSSISVTLILAVDVRFANVTHRQEQLIGCLPRGLYTDLAGSKSCSGKRGSKHDPALRLSA